jgi:hypothetical protein
MLQFLDLLHVVVALDEIQLFDWIAADEFQLAVTKVENCIPITNLSPYRRDLPAKLVKKLPLFMEHEAFFPPLVPILSQISPIRASPTFF